MARTRGGKVYRCSLPPPASAKAQSAPLEHSVSQPNKNQEVCSEKENLASVAQPGDASEQLSEPSIPCEADMHYNLNDHLAEEQSFKEALNGQHTGLSVNKDNATTAAANPSGSTSDREVEKRQFLNHDAPPDISEDDRTVTPPPPHNVETNPLPIDMAEYANMSEKRLLHEIQRKENEVSFLKKQLQSITESKPPGPTEGCTAIATARPGEGGPSHNLPSDESRRCLEIGPPRFARRHQMEEGHVYLSCTYEGCDFVKKVESTIATEVGHSEGLVDMDIVCPPQMRFCNSWKRSRNHMKVHHGATEEDDFPVFLKKKKHARLTNEVVDDSCRMKKPKAKRLHTFADALHGCVYLHCCFPNCGHVKKVEEKFARKMPVDADPRMVDQMEDSPVGFRAANSFARMLRHMKECHGLSPNELPPFYRPRETKADQRKRKRSTWRPE